MQLIGSSKFPVSFKFANVTLAFKQGLGKSKRELKANQHPTYYLKNISKAYLWKTFKSL